MSRKIVVTGAAGFIGSNLVKALNDKGYSDLVLVDRFDNPHKENNLTDVSYDEKIDRDIFIEWLSENGYEIDFLFHIGARTDTTEFNFRVLDSLNLSYTKNIWEICTAKQIPLLYASSAATYGLGENGFSDNHQLIESLKPLNPYGLSKHLFDLFALKETTAPPHWFGLKFFNVYGPHENHKGRMASVAFHAYHQVKNSGSLKLFKSHHPDYKDGEQLRDFIYVEDVTRVCLWLMKQTEDNKNIPASGIYNLGTGTARTFNALAHAIFNALKMTPNISYIDTPLDIRDKYQYFTEADMHKLRDAGYAEAFTTLETGVKKYVEYLKGR